MFEKLKRLSLWLILTPSKFINTEPFEDCTFWDFFTWSRRHYEWKADRFLDYVQPVQSLIETGEGDCEDYAVAAASNAVNSGKETVGFAFMWQFPQIWKGHVVAFDDRYTYSSGQNRICTPEEFLEDSEYSFMIKRYV